MWQVELHIVPPIRIWMYRHTPFFFLQHNPAIFFTVSSVHVTDQERLTPNDVVCSAIYIHRFAAQPTMSGLWLAYDSHRSDMASGQSL